MTKKSVVLAQTLVLSVLSAPGCSGTASPAGAGLGGNAGASESGSANQASAGAANSSSGTSSVGSGGFGVGGVAGASPDGVHCEGPCGLLVPSDGWVDSASNEHGIQGALFAYADSTSARSMESDFTGSNACIRGTAAKVDFASIACATFMFTPPATDCYAELWGAAIGMNLNQPRALAAPTPFDGSKLGGFGFELSGSNLPPPGRLRFQVESASEQMFCNVATHKLEHGVNVALFRDLVTECFSQAAHPEIRPTAESAKSALVKLSWHVVTNTDAEVPYDFCVSNIRAISE